MSEHVKFRLHWFFLVTFFLCIYIIIEGRMHDKEDELFEKATTVDHQTMQHNITKLQREVEQCKVIGKQVIYNSRK